MIYVVVGCDATCKTTLIEYIAQKTGYEVVKGSSFSLSELGSDKMYEYMYDLLEKDNIIIDRYFHCNRVYATLFPKYPLMTDEQFDLLNRRLNEVADKICLIYLFADKDIIVERIKSRGDEHIGESDVADILDLYGKVMHKYRIPEQRTIKLDTGKIELENMPNVARTIVNYANRLSEMPERRNY